MRVMPAAERIPVQWEHSAFPTVASFDPGGTTGWSIMTVHPAALADPALSVLDNIFHWEQGQIDGNEYEQVDQILELLEHWDGATVLFEGFKLLTTAAELSPVRITATVSWALQRLYDPPRVMFQQMPREKDQATDDRLRRWKLYRADGQVHARDATRHAILFMRRAKRGRALRSAAFPSQFADS